MRIHIDFTPNLPCDYNFVDKLSYSRAYWSFLRAGSSAAQLAALPGIRGGAYG